MHETVKQMAQNFSKQRTLRRRAYAAFTALALVVSISTMYTLSQPAQTMTGDPVCGMAEHVHSDACYTMQLVCGVDSHAAPEVEEVSAVEEPAPAESDAHEHDDSCYEQQEVLVCTLEEAEAHTHGDSCYGLSCGEDEYEAHTHGAECYQTRRELSCGEEEYEAHTHGAECYTTYTEQTCGEDEYEAHSHGSDCYTTSETLTCSEDESSGHSHSDGCYTEETELTCSADEGPGHTHSDSCYTEYTELTCSAKEGAGHSHSDSCYTDVEELTCSLQDGPGHTHSDACNGLVCGLEETEGHTHGDGCYEMQDVLVCTAGEEADTSDDDSAGHTESCYERVLTCGLEEHTHSSSCYEVPETVAPGADTGETICGQEEHTHEAACYDEAGTLICGLVEHTHSDECYPVPELMMVLPEGAEVPEGYDREYTYISEDATFAVAVYAPEGAIPEGATLVAEVLAEDSDAYIAAGEALDAMMAEQAAVEEEATEEPAAEEVTESESTEEPAAEEITESESTEEPAEEGAESETPEVPVVEEPAGEEAPEETKPYDGYVAMDIRFEDADGYEVEPLAPVYVCINALGLLPEEADPASVSVQHHAEVEPIATFSLRSLFAAPAEPEIVVETVADATEETGIVQVTENEDCNAQDVATAFAVESFSTFTLTWDNNSARRTITCIDTDGGTKLGTATPSSKDISEATLVTDIAPKFDGYTFVRAVLARNEREAPSSTTDVKRLQAEWTQGTRGGRWQWQYSTSTDGDSWSNIGSGSNVYFIYKPIPTQLLTVQICDLNGQKINGVAETATMNVPATGEWVAITECDPEVSGYIYTEGHLNSAQGNHVSYVRYVASADGKSGTWHVSNTTSGEGTILDPTKSVWLLYDTATIPVTIHLVDENGNEVDADVTKFITKNAETEISTLVSNAVGGRTYYQARVNSADGKLIKSINYNNTTKQWSYTTPSGAVTTMNPGVTPEIYAIYVGETFQGITPPGITVNVFNYTSSGDNGINANHKLKFTGAGAADSDSDEDGFNKWTGSDADVYQGIVGRTLTTTVVDGKKVYGNPVLQSDESSLDYLFTTTPASAKEVYDSADCLFQQNDEGYYYYDSDQNFAKLNTDTKKFDLYYRASGATNRNDPVKFAPFNEIDDYSNDGYHMGMTVEGTFIMPKGGQVNSKDMVFDFTGDDDVWVFIDGILILDLGGIHLASSGSINFATGKVGVNKVDQESADPSGTNTTIYDQVIKALGQTEGQKWVDDNMVQVNGNWVFKDYSEHTLSFFYLERGAGGSNCKIKFNLPTIPKNSLVVGKELEAGKDENGNPVASELVEFVAGNLDYTFEVLKVVDGEVTETSMFDLSNPSKLPTFQIMEDGQQVGTGTVNADGTFTLKAGQSAVFDGLLTANAGQYVVRETMPANIHGQYLGAEYDVVSGGGTTSANTNQTVEEGQFTQYTTKPLNASNTTSTVMYRNLINMKALSMLRVTKVVRPGSDIADDAEFSMKIQIDGEDLAVGTGYKILDAAGNTLRTGSTTADGIIKVKRDETIALASGILQGSVINVYEVNDGGYTIAYEGTITGGGSTTDMTVGTGGITGTVVNTNSVAHVTVYNSDYSFATSVPISKTLLGADAGEKKTFNFTMQELVEKEGQMVTTGKPYNTVINTTGDATKSDVIYFGFGVDAATGDYFYRIHEVIPTNKGGISYDESSYVVKITVTGSGGLKSAAVTGITKYTDQAATTGAKDMGANATLAFVNSKSGALSLTKIAKKDGVDLAGSYTFQIEIPTANGTFSVYKGVDLIGTVTFTNGSITGATGDLDGGDNSTIAVSNGQTITIKGLPANQKAVIRETRTDGFAVSWSGDLADAASANGPSTQTVEITGAATVAVTCTNTTGTELPSTGGIGTQSFTFLGTMMMLSAGVLLLIQRRRREAT